MQIVSRRDIHIYFVDLYQCMPIDVAKEHTHGKYRCLPGVDGDSGRDPPPEMCFMCGNIRRVGTFSVRREKWDRAKLQSERQHAEIGVSKI